MAQNVGELADLAALLVRHGVRTWEVFFLIGVGRGNAIAEIEDDEYEDVCHFLVDAAQYGMTVRTVEAPFFRRVRDWRSKRTDAEPGPGASSSGSGLSTGSCAAPARADGRADLPGAGADGRDP